MKLTDPSIKLIANGESGSHEWNEIVLKGLNGAIDFISYHAYVGTDSGKPMSVFKKINDVDRRLSEFGDFLKENYSEKPDNWKKWYRFPHRESPVKIALDEWGIWEQQDPPYGTTNTYEWRHALATACFLNVIHRNAEHVSMGNWAQMVNILAPIMTSEDASVRQTVFYPLKEYNALSLGESVYSVADAVKIDDLTPLNVSATIDRDNNLLTLFVVNIRPDNLNTRLNFKNSKIDKLLATTVLTASSLDAKNVLDRPDENVVLTVQTKINKNVSEISFAAESVTICQFALTHIQH